MWDSNLPKYPPNIGRVLEAQDLFNKGEHNRAFEIMEDLIFVNWSDRFVSHLLRVQGNMLVDLSKIAKNPDLQFTFMLGSVGCFSRGEKSLKLCARVLYLLAGQIGSVMYYKKFLEKAKQALSVLNPLEDSPDAQTFLGWQRHSNEANIDLEDLIKDAELKIAFPKIKSLKSSLEQDCKPEVLESKNSPEPLKNNYTGLRSFWLGLDVQAKRDFMKVPIANLTCFVEKEYSKKEGDTLREILAYSWEHKKWTSWMCRTKCSKKFSNAEECKNHLEQHGANFKPSSEADMVKRVGKDWARKLLAGGPDCWKPVDTAAAIEMIKNPFTDVKSFAYKNGWPKEWLLAADEERSELLKDIKCKLERYCDVRILPCSIRDYVMSYPVRHLEKFGVSKQTLVDLRLVETPQSICFLECPELNQILNFLRLIKDERDDGTEIVCRAVDSIMGSIQAIKKINFDPHFSFLLLDRRLLKSNDPPFDDEGIVNVFDPSVHYAKAHAQGDYIISWLTDHRSQHMISPTHINDRHRDMWVAVLRAVQFTCQTLETKYVKKWKVSEYCAALTAFEKMFMTKDKTRYASLLCTYGEENVRCLDSSLGVKVSLCVVRDVLKGVLDLTFDLPDCEDYLNLIRERKSLSGDIVLKNIAFLKSEVTTKVLLIDSKILLIDNSRIDLLDVLTKFSIFDNRTYILDLLKPFLLNKIEEMESRAKSDLAVADLLFEEEKSQSKKNKKKSKKRTPTNMSSPLHKTDELKPSVNLELESTSPSLKTVEEDSLEPDDTFASESGRLEILSNTVNQEEVMQNIGGEDLHSKHLDSSALGEAATRYNSLKSAVDMTPKNKIGNLESTSNSDVAVTDLLLEKEKKSKKNKRKSKKRTSKNMSRPVDKTGEYKPSVNLELKSTSPSLKTVEEDSLEPDDTLAGENGLSEIVSNTVHQEEVMQNIIGEDLNSKHVESSALGEATTRYNSAVDETLKALLNIKILKEFLMDNMQTIQDSLKEQVPTALQNVFAAFVSEVIHNEGVYSCLLSDLLASLEEVIFMSRDAAEVLVAILEFWHCWKNAEIETLVTLLFTLEENENMSCRKCRKKPNYPDQSSYGIVISADSIRDLKCALGNIDFVDIFKVIRMEYKMLCDIKTRGCGRTNFVHHIISRCPPIFTIVLDWEKSETEKEIYETTKALDREIDISRMYEGLEPNTNYRLVSMVCCGEEENEHVCLAYKKNRWFNLRHDALTGEDVGKWKSVVRFCGERKVRPEILFYEKAICSSSSTTQDQNTTSIKDQIKHTNRRQSVRDR